MDHPSDIFVQDPAEDVHWDPLVLGPYFEGYRRLLARVEEPALYEGADKPLPSELLGRAMPETPAALSPMAQVLFGNALIASASTYEGLGAVSHAAPASTASLRVVRRNEFLRSNSLLAAAVNRISGDTQLALPWIANEPGQAWASLGSLYLASLTAQFDDSVSVLLHHAGGAGRLAPVRRHRLNALLFHPLQNADQHGRNPERSRSFSGIAARIVPRLEPETPSFASYRATLGDRFSGGQDAFLEVIVHDNGVGIAAHFHDAKRKPGEPDLFSLHPFHEWQTLVNAFERHQTSKPVSFRRATTLPGAAPGVGLAGLLSALKQLRAYMELRTGRLRVYQWYRDEDAIPDRLLVQPAGLPAPGLRVPGTIFRVLVPLDTASSEMSKRDALGDEAAK